VKQMIRRLVCCLMALMLLAMPVCGLALEKSANPLLGGLTMDKHTKTEDRIVNILLLGIDYGYEQSDYISAKDELDDCHTDANVVVSINKTQKTVKLVSLPRDVLSYVPGVKGIYKLNAATGEIVWHNSYENVFYDKNVSGGVLSSPLLGKKGTALEGMIFFHIAKTPGEYNGLTVALDTASGEVIWKKALNHYCWSSPIAVYSDDGNAYIIQFDSGGYAMLMDGKSGLELNKISVGVNVEASPALFNDTLVVGTRGKKVFGIKIS